MALTPYNRTKFNTNTVATIQHAQRYSMYATVLASVNAGSLFSPSYSMNQSTKVDMYLGWGYDVDYDYRAELTTEMVADTLKSPRYHMAQETEMFADITAVFLIGYSMNSHSDAAANLSTDLYPRYTMKNEMSAAANSFIVILPIYGVQTQQMGGTFVSIPTTTTSMAFRVSIPPGGRLVIDSENYTAYLENENVMHAYEGDWIKLRRQLIGVDVSGGISGDLDVAILYREAYL